jgi:hypothetical protein
MNQFTYQLKEDLIIPATGNPNKGYLLFPKDEFGLSYEVQPNPRKKTMTVILGVAKLETDEIVWPLTAYKITEFGFVTSQYSNQSEYDAYIVQKDLLDGELAALNSELLLLTETLNGIQDQSSQEYLDGENAIALKQIEIQEKNNEIANLPIVSLKPLIINKYDDVISYFKGDGSLTEEGIAWAKTVYYGKYQLGDLIV